MGWVLNTRTCGAVGSSDPWARDPAEHAYPTAIMNITVAASVCVAPHVGKCKRGAFLVVAVCRRVVVTQYMVMASSASTTTTHSVE